LILPVLDIDASKIGCACRGNASFVLFAAEECRVDGYAAHLKSCKQTLAVNKKGLEPVKVPALFVAHSGTPEGA
jgi:hypothetical protein